MTPLTPTDSPYNEAIGPQTDQQQQMVHPFIPENSHRSSSGVVSIPVGLTSKELAHLRSNHRSHSEPTDTRQPSDYSSAATPDPDARGSVAAETSPLLPEARRLWSEVDLLRHEVQQLRAERSDAPPTYDSGEVA
jgi:hypothetical protein